MMRNQSDLRDGIQFLRNGHGGIGVVHDPESERWLPQPRQEAQRVNAIKVVCRIAQGDTTKLAESWALGSGIDPPHRSP